MGILPLYAQDSGQLTKRYVKHYGCQIDTITAKWSFRSLMGEAVVNGTYKWEAARGTDENCLSYKDFIILKVQSNTNHKAYAWVSINPTVPKSGRGYAYNTSGSPNWNSLFCGFDGNGRKSRCWDEDTAKSFWKSGFSVVDFKLKRKN